jgi:hypothetical protein
MLSRLACVGVVLLVILALPLVAADPPKDEQVVSSKATQRPAASSVNFRKDLNLPFPSLGTLGSRIETAQRAGDPVGLAHAASELATAEKVSGKTASVTSSQVAKEAAELAKLRRQEAELQALLHVSNQVMFAEDDIKSMKDQLALAQAQTKADKEAFLRKEEPKSTARQVVANNYTTQYIDVYVNGFFKGQIPPGQSQIITIEHRWNPTVLKGYGHEDNTVWGPRYVWGEFTKYTWNFN